MNAYRIRLIGYIVLALSGAAIYWPGLHGGFIFDDFPNLVADPDWKLTEFTLAQWRRAVGHGLSSDVGRPLAMASFALNHYLTGPDPFWLKLTNLCLHLFNSVLVALLCRALLVTPSAENSSRTFPAILPVILAGVWLIHPLQISTVLYVVQRMEIAAQTCVLLALLAYMRGRRNQTAGQHAWPWLLASGVATLVGMGFKESALLAPGFALLIEACVFRFGAPGGGRSRAWIVTYGATSVLALLVYALWIVPHFASAEAYGIRDFTVGQRLLTQAPVLMTYLGQAFLPLPQHLLFYYDHYPLSTGLISPPHTAIALSLLFALLLTAALCWRRWPLVSLGIGWFLTGHALTSNVFPLELAFEHRNYLALLGILLALVDPMQWIANKLTKPVRVIAGVACLATLTLLCSLQVHTWASPERLTYELATRNQASPRATYYLGEMFFMAAGRDYESPQWAMARREFEHVTEISPRNPMGEQALLIMDGRSGKSVSPELWDRLRYKLTLRDRAAPDVVSALHALVSCRAVRQCTWDEGQLLKTLLTVMERYPKEASLHAIYANYAHNVLGDSELAISMLREATRLDPSNTQHLASLTKLLVSSGSSGADAEARVLTAKLKALNVDGHLTADLAAIRRMLSASGE